MQNIFGTLGAAAFLAFFALLLTGHARAADDDFPCEIDIHGSPGSGGWRPAPVVVALDGVDDEENEVDSLRYRIDGGSLSLYGARLEFRVSGEYDVECFAYREDGTPIGSTFRTVRVDAEVPSCQIEHRGARGDGSWWTERGPVVITASDPSQGSGIDAITSRTKGPAFERYGAPLRLVDGENKVECRAHDKAGNRGESSRTFLVDATPPTCEFGKPEGLLALHTKWLARADRLSVKIADTHSGIKSADVLYRAEPLPVVAGSVDLGPLGEGRHELTCKATDRAGHLVENTFEVLVDASAPTCTVLLDGRPATQARWLRHIPHVEVRAEGGPSGITSSAVGLLTGSGFRDVPEQVADGRHALGCSAVDGAGHKGQSQGTLMLDRAPPGPCALSTLAERPERTLDGWHGSAVTVSWTGVDELSGVDAVDLVADGTPLYRGLKDTLTITAHGRHSVRCELIDEAGNRGPAKELSIDIDVEPPTCRIDVGDIPQTGWQRAYGQARVRVDDDGVGVQDKRILLNGLPTGSEFALDTDGIQAVTCFATDRFGQEAHARIEVPIDATPPGCELFLNDAPPTGGIYIGPVRARIVATDATSGPSYASWPTEGGGSDAIFLDSGTYALRCEAGDIAGNTRGLDFPSFTVRRELDTRARRETRPIESVITAASSAGEELAGGASRTRQLEAREEEAVRIQVTSLPSSQGELLFGIVRGAAWEASARPDLEVWGTLRPGDALDFPWKPEESGSYLLVFQETLGAPVHIHAEVGSPMPTPWPWAAGLLLVAAVAALRRR